MSHYRNLIYILALTLLSGPLFAQMVVPMPEEDEPFGFEAEEPDAPEEAPPAPEASDEAEETMELNLRRVEDEPLGFTWGNDVPELIRRGNKQYEVDEYGSAENLYQDAYLKKPGEAIAAFNLGLARAKSGQQGEAIESFRRALNLAGRIESEERESELRADALYNLGLSQFDRAKAAMKEQQQGGGEEVAKQQAIEALDSFMRSKDFRPDFPDADYNLNQVRHFLHMLSVPPPEQEQQQQQQGGGDQQQQQEQQQQQPQDQDQQQQDQPQQGDQQQQQQGQQDQEQQQQGQQQGEEEQEQQEQQGQQGDEEEESQEQEQEQQGQGEAQAEEMTEDQARQLFNLLGEAPNIVLRKARSANMRPETEKDW